MKCCIMAVCFLLCFSSLAFASSEDLLNQSIEVLYELSKSVDRKILAPLFAKAWGIAIFPQVKRVGFFVGVAEGEGVLFARGRNKETFLGPAFYTIQGVTLGIQAGMQSQDIVLSFMRKPQGATIVLGGNFSVTLGPTGRGFSAAIDTELTSPCYAYALSRGIFTGISFEGTQMREHTKANREFWKQDIPATTILSQFLPPDFASRNLARLLVTLAWGGDTK